jgi:hypothetical protein
MAGTPKKKQRYSPRRAGEVVNVQVHRSDEDARPVHVTLFGHDHRYELAWMDTDAGPVVTDLRITSDDGVPITSKSVGRINVERLAQAAALHDTSAAARNARALRAALQAVVGNYADPEAAVSDACAWLDSTGDPAADDAATALRRASTEHGAAVVIADALNNIERHRFTEGVIRALADRRPGGASDTTGTNVGGRPPTWTPDFLALVAEWARDREFGGNLYERVAERAQDHLGEQITPNQVKHWIKQAKRANLLRPDELRQPRRRQQTPITETTTTTEDNDR